MFEKRDLMKNPLSKLAMGEVALIQGFSCESTMLERLKDLGFVCGAKVQALFRAPLGGASVFRVENTTVALRDEESQCIFVGSIK